MVSWDPPLQIEAGPWARESAARRAEALPRPGRSLERASAETKGGAAVPSGSKSGCGRPADAECVRPRGADASGFRRRPKSGAPPVPRDLRPGDGPVRLQSETRGPERPSGAVRGRHLCVREGCSGGLGPSTSDRSGPLGPRVRGPTKPRHCLGRAVRRSAGARRRRGVRQSRRVPNPGVAAPRTRYASALGGRTHPDFVDGRNPGPHRSARNCRAVVKPRRVNSISPRGRARPDRARAESRSVNEPLAFTLVSGRRHGCARPSETARVRGWRSGGRPRRRRA